MSGFFSTLRAVSAIAILIAAGCAACGPINKPGSDVEPEPVTAHIVVSERALSGGRLVLLTEDGTRVANLTEGSTVPIRDNSPAWSPDGRWVAFASSRGRNDMTETSIWIVAARPGATPRRLMSGYAVDRDPAWLPDGTAIVFASSRGGSFDLWQVALSTARYGWPIADGSPTQLTRAPGHELYPSVAPDGRVAYTGVEADGSRSRIWLLEGGATRAVTEGPADLTPAWSPDGATIAFAAPTRRDDPPDKAKCPEAEFDADLYTVSADGRDRALVFREPLADQTGPVWSADGRYLFATSVYRSVETCRSVLSSVTFVDLREAQRTMRALHDPAVVESRTGPAIDGSVLNATVLHRNQEYADALKAAIIQEIIRAQSRD